MSYILSKDAALYYEEYGSGRTLILLPGLLGTIESHWRRFLPEFSRHFHTVAVDLRGHGKTNNPAGKLRLEMLVDDLHALVDTLQIERALICGYSLGGYIGLAYGLRHPGKIPALIMHGTKFFWTEQAVSAMIAQLDPESIMAKVPAWGQALQRDHQPANGTDGWRHLLLASAEFIRSLSEDGLNEATLALADFPILVSRGDADEIIPQEEAERLVSLLPNAAQRVLLDAKHPLQSVRKEALVEMVLEFHLNGTSVRK